MKLLKNISVFTFFNLVNAGIPFLLLPILTTYLSPEDYGVVDIFNSLIMLFTPIVALSIVGSIDRYYFEIDKVNFKIFVDTIFKTAMIYGLIFISIVIVLGLFLKNYILIKLGLPIQVLILVAIYVFFTQLGEVLLAIWRVSYKTSKYGIFRVSKTVLDICLSLILIINLDFSWDGRIIPQVITAVLFGCIAIYFLNKNGFLNKGFKIDASYKKKALSYGVPLIFHSLSGYVIGISDRFFILFMEGVGHIGVYAVAYQIGMVIGLFQNSFNQAWVPFFFSSLKKESIKLNLKIVKITYLYFAFMILLVVVFYFVTPFIYKVFIGNEFQEGLHIVVWILMGYGFNGMYKMVVNYLFYLKKTKTIAITTIISGILNLVLNYFLIKRNGIIGAAQATAISFLVHFLLVYWLSCKYYSMPWNLKIENEKN